MSVCQSVRTHLHLCYVDLSYNYLKIFLLYYFRVLLTDAFGRVIFTHLVADTRVIWETRSPTWDQMLVFKDVVLWGDVNEIAVNPPTIVIEVFDKDIGVGKLFFKNDSIFTAYQSIVIMLMVMVMPMAIAVAMLMVVAMTAMMMMMMVMMSMRYVS